MQEFKDDLVDWACNYDEENSCSHQLKRLRKSGVRESKTIDDESESSSSKHSINSKSEMLNGISFSPLPKSCSSFKSNTNTTSAVINKPNINSKIKVKDELNVNEVLLTLPNDIAGHEIIMHNNKHVLINKHAFKTTFPIPKSKRIDEIGQEVVPYMIDSTALFDENNDVKLYQNFKKYGYIYIRERIPENDINKAYKEISQQLDNIENDYPDYKVHGAIEVHEGDVIGFEYQSNNASSSSSSALSSTQSKFKNEIQKIYNLKSFQKVLNHDKINHALSLLANGKTKYDKIDHDILKFDPKYVWLRVKKQNQYTAEHADIFHFRVSISDKVFVFLVFFLFLIYIYICNI